MKKTILLIIISLASAYSQAQYNTNLAVSPQPPGSILSWSTKDLSYLINNQQGATRNALIKSVLTLTDGTPVASTNLAIAKVIRITPGTLLLTAADVIPLDAMTFVGKYKTVLERTGKLPASSYQLCVQLVTPVDFIPLSEPRCRIFTLASYQLPIPVMPANDDVLEAEKAQTAITFRWTPVFPRPAETVRYIVTVFEILDKQTPLQALRSNQPLLTKEIIGTTQFIWQPQLSFIKTKIWTDDTASNAPSLYKEKPRPSDKPITETHGDPHVDRMVMDSIDATHFIWTIKTVNSSGIPFSDGNINNDGISEPNTFTVVKDRRRKKTGVPVRTIYLDYIHNKTK